MSSPEKASGGGELNHNKIFIIVRTLGRGSFGKVKEAMHVISGEKLAIKILEKDKIKKEDDLLRIRREIEILNRVRHSSIIQLYEVDILPYRGHRDE